MNKWNRQIPRFLGIRAAGEPLGRVPLSMKTQEAQRQIAEDKAKRNEVEGQFGTTKRIYDADDVRAKRPDTGEAWTALCFLAKNLGRFMKTLSSSFFCPYQKTRPVAFTLGGIHVGNGDIRRSQNCFHALLHNRPWQRDDEEHLWAARTGQDGKFDFSVNPM